MSRRRVKRQDRPERGAMKSAEESKGKRDLGLEGSSGFIGAGKQVGLEEGRPFEGIPCTGHEGQKAIVIASLDSGAADGVCQRKRTLSSCALLILEATTSKREFGLEV